MGNMVVCPEPLAAAVGRDIFAAGGNVVDAAIAAAFVQGVVNPFATGIGGFALLYFHDAESGQGTVMNGGVAIGSRPVPGHWVDEFVGRSETVGRFILESEANQVGHYSIMVPGFVRCCWDAFQRFGSGLISWPEVLSRGVELARDGFIIDAYVDASDKASVSGSGPVNIPGYPTIMAKLGATPDAGKAYLKANGELYKTGETLVQARLADTLQQLADAGGDDFYEGDIGDSITKYLESHNGFITASDLRNYAVDDLAPLEGRYREYKVFSTPAGSGAHLIEILQILNSFDLVDLGHNSPEYIDTFSRVLRATFTDNVALKCMDFREAAPLEQGIVKPERAAYWADRISQGDRVVVKGGEAVSGTTHVSAIDDHGNIVTFTHSVGSLGGSGVVAPELGFMFNDFLGHFNPLPGHPNSIEPGKKMVGGTPTIVFDQDEPYIVIGAPGGSRILTAVAQSIVNVIDHGMDMETAVSVPRFHSEEEQLVFIEPNFSDDTASALQSMGNDVQRSSYMSRVQAVRVRSEDGELEGGSDPRGGVGVGRYP